MARVRRGGGQATVRAPCHARAISFFLASHIHPTFKPRASATFVCIKLVQLGKHILKNIAFS